MPTLTSANTANAIAKMVAVEALDHLQGNLVMANLVNRNYEAILASAGDTVNIPIPPVLVANDLAEGGSVATQNPNLGNAQIVLNKHKESTVKIPDVTKALANPDLIKIYINSAVIALAEAIETDLLNLYPQFTGNPVIGLPGAALTEAVIDQAETMLFNQKVPQNASKWLVVDGSAYSTLRTLPRFSEAQMIGSDAAYAALASGAVGKLKDFTVFRSQFIAKTGSAPVTAHHLAFAQNSIGLAMRKLDKPLDGTGAIVEYAENAGYGLRVVMSFDPNTMAQQFTIHALYGAAVLRNRHGVQVES